jgi:hypothetical protein
VKLFLANLSANLVALACAIIVGCLLYHDLLAFFCAGTYHAKINS